MIYNGLPVNAALSLWSALAVITAKAEPLKPIEASRSQCSKVTGFECARTSTKHRWKTTPA